MDLSGSSEASASDVTTNIIDAPKADKAKPSPATGEAAAAQNGCT